MTHFLSVRPKMTLGSLIGTLSWVVRRSQTRFIIRVWHVKIQSHVVDLRTIFLTFFCPKKPSGTFEILSFRENGHFDSKTMSPDILSSDPPHDFEFSRVANFDPYQGATDLIHLVQDQNFETFGPLIFDSYYAKIWDF